MSEPRKEAPISVFDIWMDYSDYRDRHQHAFHEFFVLLEGEGEQYTPEGVQKMSEGDVFFFPAGVEHMGNGDPGGTCLGGVLYVHERSFLGDGSACPGSAQILKALRQLARRKQYRLSLSSHGRDACAGVFTQMLAESKQKKPGYAVMLHALLHRFLIGILRHSHLEIATAAAERPVSEEQIHETVRFLEVHFREPVDIEHAAQLANMSRSHFHARFKEVTGSTFIGFLNALRIKNAVALLADGEVNAEQAAFRSGFTSLSHFYKVFREATGTTPSKIHTVLQGSPKPQARPAND